MRLLCLWDTFGHLIRGLGLPSLFFCVTSLYLFFLPSNSPNIHVQGETVAYLDWYRPLFVFIWFLVVPGISHNHQSHLFCSQLNLFWTIHEDSQYDQLCTIFLYITTNLYNNFATNPLYLLFTGTLSNTITSIIWISCLHLHKIT